MTTLKRSKQLSFAELESLPADFLAKQFPTPESEVARKMIAGSGLRCLELLEKQTRVGYLSKMLLVSLRWGSTMCYMTWKVERTSAKHLLFRLSPSMQDIADLEFSLFPTPTQDSIKERKKNYSQGGTPLTKAVMLFPTPMSPTGHQIGTMREWGGSRNKLRSPEMEDLGNGAISPMFVEWLMGFPIGWTDCED